MKRLLTFVLCVGLVWGVGIVVAQAAPVLLADDGNHRAVIVIPENPHRTEVFAAGELRDYIEKISGARLPIISEKQADYSSPRLLVGRSELTVHVGNLLRGRPDDAFIVRVERQVLGEFVEGTTNWDDRDGAWHDIFLVGAGPRGTLYAVYDFLEQDLGCRWLGPGELWEHVPQHAKLEVTPANRLESPVFLYRTCSSFPHWHGWSLKNKANLGGRQQWPFEWMREHYRSEELPPVDLPGMSGAHTSRRLLPVDGGGVESRVWCRMLTEKPEWFPLQRAGTRRPPYFCHANPEVNHLFSDRISQVFRERPHMDFVQLGEADGYGRYSCNCETCLDVNARGGMSHQTARGTDTYRLMVWLNTVANLVAETDPDKKLMGVAYASFQEPPDPQVIRPADNVMMEYFTWANCLAHGYEHVVEDDTRLPEGLSHADSRDWIERWAAMTPAGMIMAQYHGRGSMGGIGGTMPRRYINDMSYLHSHGFTGYLTYIGRTAWGLFTINRYAVLKAAWNPDLDEDELIRDYCDHAFHEASEHMQAFINVIETAIEESGCCHSRMVDWTTDSEKLAAARAHLDAAHALAEGNETLQERLLSWEIPFRYAELAGPAIAKIIRGAYQEQDAALLREGLEDENLQKAADYADEISAQYRERAIITTGDRPDLGVIFVIGRTSQGYLRENSGVRRILSRLEEAQKNGNN